MQHRRKRVEELLNKVRMEGSTTLQELAASFDVSTATIRRDIKQLEENNAVVQTVGGGVMYRGTSISSFSDEQGIPYLDEKLRIAEYCSELVESHDEIIVGPGTTTFLAGKIMSGVTGKPFRIITNSLEIALETSRMENISTVVLGGVVSGKHTVGFEGHGEYFDTCHDRHTLLLSADGIDLEHGVTLFDSRYLDIMKNMVRVSNRIILAADSSKLGQTRFLKVCELERVHMLVTDSAAGHDFCDAVRARGVEVVLV